MQARFAILVALLVGTLPLRAAAQVATRDDFEGPEVSLVEAGADANYRLEAHARTRREAHAGQWCERLAVRGNNGTHVFLGRDVGPARVISELVAQLWVKADRPGLQLAVHVTLPRTVDPETGKPLSALVRGTSYERVGAWQQLRVDNIPKLLEGQVRVLRTQFGPDVDPREACVDRVLLNVYGGPGLTNVWVDDLEMTGVVGVQGDSRVVLASGVGPPAVAAPRASPVVPPVELRWPLLLVGGKPFFPRAIDHQGEPLARLQALGFNTVRVARPATVELLREAASLGLWVMASPPPPAALAPRPGEPMGAKFGPGYDSVLVWDLGRGLAKRELDETKRWARLVSAADTRARPLICQPESELVDYSRHAKLLLAGRNPLGSPLSLSDYLLWLRERPQIALPGTPLWVTIQTQPPPQLLEQMALIDPSPTRIVSVSESQIRMLVRVAMAGGARGLCFESNSRLDATDAQTRRRAAVLELVNLELDLIERWPASGNFTSSASSNDPHATGAVIETDRSRLLLPIYSPPGGQFVLGNPAALPLNLTAPGVPEGDDAYELTPTSLRPLRSDRVLGGTRVLLSDAERDALVVFTQDPRVLGSLKQRIAKTASRAAQLVRDIAAAELAEVDSIEARLAALGRVVPATRKVREAAANDLRQCDALLAKQDSRSAYDLARRTLGALADIERGHFDRLPEMPWPDGDLWRSNFATLPEHYRFASELASAPRGPNLLAEGGFEDLQAMRRAGWVHYQHPPAQAAVNVELATQSAHEGRTGLRLVATLADPKVKINVVETPPLWVTSPQVSVAAGTLVEIQGWVRVPGPITGSVDGLLIIDTITGEALAQRAAPAPQWRPFSVLRAMPRSGPLAVTFALSGLGEAWIDDVCIRVVQRGAPLPPQQQAQQIRTEPQRPGG